MDKRLNYQNFENSPNYSISRQSMTGLVKDVSTDMPTQSGWYQDSDQFCLLIEEDDGRATLYVYGSDPRPAWRAAMELPTM